jgi:hypothetical protein
MIDKSTLIHYKIQAAIREKNIPENKIKYIGESQNTHWYRINNKQTIPVNIIESFEPKYNDTI